MKTTTQVRKSFKMGPHLDRSLLERSHFPHCKALDLQVRKATLYCSRLRISRTAAKPSLHHVRGIVCRTHSNVRPLYRVLPHSTLFHSNIYYTQTLVFLVVQSSKTTEINFNNLSVK